MQQWNNITTNKKLVLSKDQQTNIPLARSGREKKKKGKRAHNLPIIEMKQGHHYVTGILRTTMK